MGLAKTFPATTWIVRLFVSRPARVVYISLLSFVLIVGVGFRIEAAVFARRASRLASTLATVQIGKTTRAEVLRRMPNLVPESSLEPGTRCDADECLAQVAHTTTLLGPLSNGNSFLFSALQKWGIRFGQLYVFVAFKSGTVCRYGYQLIISEPDSLYPGAMFIYVSSREHLGEIDPITPVADESPDYRVGHHNKWPELNTRIAFTASAPRTLVQHAFDLQLGCLWSLRGCLNANQVLPEPEQDGQRILSSMLKRLRSHDQCPEWILARRARDVPDILLVTVEKVGAEGRYDYPSTPFHRVDFRLERVLQGKVDRPLKNVPVYLDINLPWGETDETVHNSAYDLMRPGQRLMLFSDMSTNIDSPCEAMAATDSAIKTVENNLAAKSE